MINNKPFLKRILLLGVAPTLFTGTLLVVGFFWIQNVHIENTKRQFISLVENTFLAKPVNVDSAVLLQDLQPLLYIEPITNLSIVDEDRNIIDQTGLPLDGSKLNSVTFNKASKSVSNDHKEILLAIPYKQDQNHYWLISQIKTSSLRESVYQGIILIILITAIALAIIVLIGQKLNFSIVQPLKNIIQQLRTTLNASQHNEIVPDKNTPYVELIDTINEMISLQHSAQDEMQNYVEQSTRELRETLETVEIQNIELDIARKNALQASRAKSEFLANTSHELRTPLNGILGFTSLLLKTGLTNQQKDYLTTIEQSAQGLLTVINDILDFSKLETGQLTLEYKPIYVRELIEEVFSVYAPQAHEKNIHLLSIVNHNVPRNLLGDPQRLKQVLTNIISNSIKFSARGNVVVRCNALGEMDSQVEIKFAITDNGIGLTEEQQDNLFKAFTKVDSSDSRLQGGTGLGLAIAKGLVDRMHGDIGVESELRSGSTFWFTVKLGVDKQRISQSPLMNSLYGVSALVYDANPSGRLEITHLLSSWGITFIEESNFKNISPKIAAHSHDNIDLLIIDTYTNENNFDKSTLLNQVRLLNHNCHCPMILLAPPAIQRNIQEDIIGLNAIIVQRPLAHNNLHQSICSLLSIVEPKSIEGSSLPPSKNQVKKATGIKILVVDDNPANRKLVCEFLTPLGTTTTSVESGYEALEAIEGSVFDLILMDVQMPGMDGLETTKLIRSKEAHSRTPIVALTAHAVAEQKTKLLLAGMDDFLSKPVSEEDLVNTIDRWVKQDLDHDSTKAEIPLATESAQPKKTTPAATSPQTDATFNLNESLKLAKNNPGLAMDMLNMLVESLDETAAKLSEALEANNTEQLFEINHKFHGGCCYCGVPSLRSATQRLESALHNESTANVSELAQDVLFEIEKLKSWTDEHDIEALFTD